MPSGIAQNPTTESANPAPTFDLLTPRQLAAELHMCLRTLYRLHESRSGPPRITLGKHIYYRRSSVAAWLQSRENSGVQPARKPVSRTRNTRRARRAA